VHRVLATLVNEQVHHGVEISLLRDLYRNRGSLQPLAASGWRLPAGPEGM
jgi:hypothetical protein